MLLLLFDDESDRILPAFFFPQFLAVSLITGRRTLGYAFISPQDQNEFTFWGDLFVKGLGFFQSGVNELLMELG